MENDKNRPAQSVLNFWGLLTVALIVLRLCGVISWPWILILLPELFGVFIDVCVATFLLYIIKKLRGER